MPGILTPARRTTSEILDDPTVGHSLRRRSHRDIALANALFGGTRALLLELADVRAAPSGDMSFLDVGTGTGEGLALAERFFAERGVRLRTFALDSDAELARIASRHAHETVCGSALALPFADSSIDVVACSQVLHHFDGDDATEVLIEMDRVARFRVIVSDLRRSWLAAGGLWLASFPLRFHPISRHDGILSILRGFTGAELSDRVYHAVGQRPRVRRRWSFRLTASWSPNEQRYVSPTVGGVPAHRASP